MAVLSPFHDKLDKVNCVLVMFLVDWVLLLDEANAIGLVVEAHEYLRGGARKTRRTVSMMR